MGVFDEVKERVTAREVMERAGIVFNRNNMCRCPFHQDKTASMKVKPTDKKYFCFGCGEKVLSGKLNDAPSGRLF
jgi:DNA primase